MGLNLKDFVKDYFLGFEFWLSRGRENKGSKGIIKFFFINLYNLLVKISGD